MNINKGMLAAGIIMAGSFFAGCKKDKGGNPIALDAYDNIGLGGWDGVNGSGLDIDNGTVYGYGSLNGAARYVDIFFDRSAFFSYDADGNELPDVGTRFAQTNFTPAQFDAMMDDRLFHTLEPAASADSVVFKVDDVILFKTRWGKKGLIRIKSMTSPTGDLNCDLKAETK